uniref:Glucanase n=1 Tax=Malbranchea cinnamomea TaxID=5041 RepID=S6DXG7_MALCI|nr:glycoside hydrolase 6 [Malbranchea cinnamomea]
MRDSLFTLLSLALGSASASPFLLPRQANSSNPFAGHTIYPNPYYSNEIDEFAIPALQETDPALVEKAALVKEVGTFFWIDVVAKVPDIGPYLQGIQEANAAGQNPPYIGAIVVYDLPNRDCAAAASNGEFSLEDGGEEKYRGYIDGIREQIEKYPDVRVALVIEPDSLANMVTNLNVPKCAESEQAYRDGVAYALKQLDLPNVWTYIDAGHSGWLGWPANIEPAAEIFVEVWNAAGRPKSTRGFATNVSNYNGYSLSTAPPYTEPNPNFDEVRYINAFRPLLEARGFPAYFIVDQGRSGVQPTAQIEQGHWCNVIDTGFGTRPTTDTGNEYVDSIVWVKPGGESDGTSDTSAERYDYHCGLEDALKPAPEAGQWFQAYFEQLLRNANPPF